MGVCLYQASTPQVRSWLPGARKSPERRCTTRSKRPSVAYASEVWISTAGYQEDHENDCRKVLRRSVAGARNLLRHQDTATRQRRRLLSHANSRRQGFARVVADRWQATRDARTEQSASVPRAIGS